MDILTPTTLGVALLFAWVGGLYAAYGILFILAVTALVISEIACLEFDNGTGATSTLLIAGGLALIVTRAQWTWAGLTMLIPRVAVFVIVYFLIGACWSVLKWYFFTRALREAYDVARLQVIGQRLDPQATTTEQERILRQWRQNLGYRYRNLTIPPDPADHTGRILMWIGHWPFSMLWTLINDPVRRIVEWLYGRLKNIYRAISKSAFADIDVRVDDDR